MDVIRADQEQVGGTIHKPMFERLMLCDYAVADVTGANPNVYYELGIRHALRPRSTVIVFAEGTALPFDVASQRGTPYRMDASSNLDDVPGDVARDPGAAGHRPCRHARRQPAVPARRRHAAARDRPRQDRHLSRPGRHRRGIQEAAGRGARRRASTRCGPLPPTRTSPTCATSRPASSSTCCSPSARSVTPTAARR